MSLIDRRTMELATAAAIGVFGGLIVAGSMQLDSGWSAETGPQSGYLPLRLGAMLCLVSVLLFLSTLRSADRGSFVNKQQLKLTLAVFVPTVVLVFSMPYVGSYSGSWLYLMYMLKVHGHTNWLKAIVLPACVVVTFYLVFELWFQVELVKGPVESLLGI
jgi:hypothetical protein